MVQWVGPHAPNAEGKPGLIPGQGTRFHSFNKDPTCHNQDLVKLNKSSFVFLSFQREWVFKKTTKSSLMGLPRWLRW